MISKSPQSFDEWYAEISSSPEDPADLEGRTLLTMRLDVRAYLQAQFALHGPITGRELSELIEGDEARVATMRLHACQDLLPAVLDDAAASGITGLRVVFEVDPYGHGGVLMTVRHPSWSSERVYGDNEPEGSGPALGWDADTLAWLATGIQEACLLGPRPQAPEFWPLCRNHGAGVHPRVAAGLALWWCSADAGHAVGAIGELGRAPEPL